MKTGRFVLAALVVCILAGPAGANSVWLENPDWQMEITDYGYSDNLWDKVTGREGREYLSGEWGAAVGYKVGAAAVTTPVWLEPNFIYPNWTTNSDFGIVGAGMMPGANNGDGLPTASGTIDNSKLRIKISVEMLDTTSGIEQGAYKASGAGAGISVTSNRYILKQSYEITNISGENITQLQLFQLCHSLEAEVALYDDRNYGGAYSSYQYDTSQVGASEWIGGGLFGEVILEDVVTFHSSVEPTAVENGYYGKQLIDEHGTGKPSIGVHLSVEGNSLDGTDYFHPDEPWISGAQRYNLIDLADDESVTFDLLLSISTEVIPEPGTLGLLILGGLLALRQQRRV